MYVQTIAWYIGKKVTKRKFVEHTKPQDRNWMSWVGVKKIKNQENFSEGFTSVSDKAEVAKLSYWMDTNAEKWVKIFVCIQHSKIWMLISNQHLLRSGFLPLQNAAKYFQLLLFQRQTIEMPLKVFATFSHFLRWILSVTESPICCCVDC